jgi:hypothetical protein
LTGAQRIREAVTRATTGCSRLADVEQGAIRWSRCADGQHSKLLAHVRIRLDRA